MYRSPFGAIAIRGSAARSARSAGGVKSPPAAARVEICRSRPTPVGVSRSQITVTLPAGSIATSGSLASLFAAESSPGGSSLPVAAEAVAVTREPIAQAAASTIANAVKRTVTGLPTPSLSSLKSGAPEWVLRCS